jgi:hypothetical protein
MNIMIKSGYVFLFFGIIKTLFGLYFNSDFVVGAGIGLLAASIWLFVINIFFNKDECTC